MSKVMAAFVGASYREKVSARGEIQEITGIREMTRKMKEGLDEDLREEFRQMETDPFEGPMENLEKNRWEIRVPAGAVSPGESWEASTTQTIPPLGEIGLKEIYTLKEIRNGRKEAIIAYQLEFTQKSVPDGKPKLELEIKGENGMILWDLERGRLQSYKVDLQMEMSMEGENHALTTTYEMKLVPMEDR